MAPLRDRRADRGHDPRRARRRTPLLLLAPRGPLRRPGHHRPPVRPAPRARAPLPPRTAGAALGAVRGRPSRAPRPASPDRDYYHQAAERLGGNRACLARRAQAAQAQLPHPARARRGGARSPHDRLGARAALTHTDAPRPAPGMLLPPRTAWTASERPSGRNASPSGITPSTIMSPARRTAGSRTEIRLGARAHHTAPPTAPTPPQPHTPTATTKDQTLDVGLAAQIRTTSNRPVPTKSACAFGSKALERVLPRRPIYLFA